MSLRPNLLAAKASGQLVLVHTLQDGCESRWIRRIQMHTTESNVRDILTGADRPALDAIIAATPIEVIADNTGTILRVSPFSGELSGWRSQEVEGLTIAEYVSTFKPADPSGRLLKENELPLKRALKGECVIKEQSFLHR